ncbi:MAG: beta-propeller domain-containing protein [Patescibacteria group bacterium]
MKNTIILASIIVLVIIGAVVYLIYTQPSGTNTNGTVATTSMNMATFTSEQDFKDYLAESAQLADSYNGMGLGSTMNTRELMVEDISGTVGLGASDLSAAPKVDRASDTNVQVVGIDEPDYVKTDGSNIFFSPQNSYYRQISFESMPYYSENKTKVIKAFPPADLAERTDIDKNGELLLSDDTLMVLSGDAVFGYDVSNPDSPKEAWTVEYGSNASVVSSRLYNGKMYLIMQSYVYPSTSCPLEPLVINDKNIEIPCNMIYHPITTIPVDTTYTVFVINPTSGKVEKDVSFVGNSSQSVVYMSANAIYATYMLNSDPVDYMYNFIEEEATDLFTQAVRDKIKKLRTYDISSSSKYTELSIIMSQSFLHLTDDESTKLQSELANRLDSYYAKHQRDLTRTGIVKIGLDDFKVSANGQVPGTPLNQFSLDEYNGNLRIATTIGSAWGWGGSTSDSVNDVYVLDGNLKQLGSALDMGQGERIYSARFIKDKGYIVTFRQTDPFYVLDLSTPNDPQIKGELKIPGYSSYLHPLTDTMILGVGKEDSNVKLSLFDVTDPTNPTEQDKYIMEDYWSDILNTHHAFLQDAEHEVFFMPGGSNGYVFSYENNTLAMERAVSNIEAKRAVYVNDFLYVIGEEKIVVLDENTWQEVNSLSLT